MFHSRFRRVFLASCGAAVLATAANATVVDTFDNNTNLGSWRLTNNPNFPLTIQPTGGNPGAFLQQQISTAVPTWFVSIPTNNPFLGDYVAKGVTSFSFDMTISGGIQVPNRNMTLHLFTTLGTGDPSQGIDAYSIGTDISQFPSGWHDYSYALPAASVTSPAGWVVTEGNGNPGTDADWHNLVTHIENITMALGTPGFAYPNLGVWTLGLDNVTLTTTLPGDATGDGTVHVDDLLAVITAWGPCASCNNCPTDFNGDCQTNVDDLLAVISHWG